MKKASAVNGPKMVAPIRATVRGALAYALKPTYASEMHRGEGSMVGRPESATEHTLASVHFVP